jgi:hypothetical protein
MSDKFRTGNAALTSRVCYLVTVPAALWFIAEVADTLAEMTNDDNWVQVGSVTVDEAREAAQLMFDGFLPVEFQVTDCVLQWRPGANEDWIDLQDIDACGPTVDIVELTNQSADIGVTNFASANVVGTYRISYYILTTTTAVGAGSVRFTVAWNDGTGARSINAAMNALTAPGPFAQGTIFVRLGSGSVSFNTTHTGIYSTAKYAVYITCERVS